MSQSLVLQRWQTLAILGALALLLGVGTIVNPPVAVKSLLTIFGLAAISVGLYGFFADERSSAPGDTFWGALFCVMLGVASVVLTELTWTIMAYVVAVQCGVAAVVQVSLIVEMRHERVLARVLSLSAILSLLLGLLLVLTPTTTLMALFAFLGFCLLVIGIVLLILAFDAHTIAIHQRV
ncbi:MAG TPA: DUF308 domain-containing protein [Ktedonobacterales bacterium]|nr:DUF308 domain-containing protein [Ktedonobacterales bacterium]